MQVYDAIIFVFGITDEMQCGRVDYFLPLESDPPGHFLLLEMQAAMGGG